MVLCSWGGEGSKHLIYLEIDFKIKGKRLSHIPASIFVQNANLVYIKMTFASPIPKSNTLIQILCSSDDHRVLFCFFLFGHRFISSTRHM